MADSSDETKGGASGAHPPVVEESHANLGDVLGLIAHDLRNPLAALSSNVGFLNMVGDDMSEDAREAVVDLQLSIEAMGRIVDSVELLCHDLKGNTGQTPLALTVGTAVHAVEAQAKRAAASHGVELKFELGPHEADRFQAAEVAFSRALTALLHNALTVAPPRSTVTLSVRVQDDEVHFVVEDDGPALDPDLAAAAVTAGGQVEIKTAPGGRYSRGLGLYVVARSAELARTKLRIGARDNGSQLTLVAPSAA